MPKFRKKPVVIEAVRWNGYSNNLGLTNGASGSAERFEMPEWMPPVSRDVTNDKWPGQTPEGAVWRDGECLLIGTLEGAHIAKPGDWIIRGVKGELYPCKPDIFEQTYEAA